MVPDPFAGPSHDPNPDRPRPEVLAGYPGECFCGTEYDDGDLIRATADGAGWEAVDHGHDPEESLPSDPVEVGRLPLPAPPEGLYTSPVTEGEGLYADSPPDTRAPEQFSCPECPKRFAPTKDRLVRTHKRPSDGERCPGSRSVPVELADQAVPAGVPEPPKTAAVPVAHRFSADPEAVAVLAGAVAMSPQVAGIVDRVNSGRTGLLPSSPEIDQDTGVDLETLAAVQFADLLAAPPEDAPDAAHDEYEKRLDAAVPQTPDPEPAASAPALANPEVDRAALYTPRPAEPEPTVENGGREPRYGRYLLPNPKTGKGKTWRRATTFARQLDDTYNLDAWQRRHLVRGAAMAAATDPARLAPYAQLDVREDKQILNDLAEALMTESGVHTAAEQGTLVHTLTEDVDRATTAEQDADAWYAVPEHYAADVAAYSKALETYGLRVVPSLLERRTAVLEYGVAGTFDQVCEVVRLMDWSRRDGLAVGDFVVTDKKTGSDMSYGTGTHGIQLWLYARGINTSGVWDAFTGQWTHPVTVREDVGIIVHIPLEKGECTLHSLNLRRGQEGAMLVQQGYDRARLLTSQALRFSRAIGTVTVPRPTPAPQESPVQQPDPMQPWRDRLATVSDPQQAYAAYQAAVDAGMPADLLASYQQALTGRLAAVQPPQPAPAADPMDPWLEQASRVETLDQAKALYEGAVAAGMPDPFQKRLTDALDQRLKELSTGPAGPDVQSVEYWTTPAMTVTSPAQAKVVYDAMIAAGVPDDVKASISQRMQDWLASQQQAAVMAAQTPEPSVPAGPPGAASPQWDAWAREVTTNQQAGSLFSSAQQAPGMTEQRLSELTAVMQRALDDQPPF
jgi:hypothetical protein